ncbi:MAG: hypothetical protein IPK76_16045 [Lewinellaceae bacterium]|nr:hypothetical protein [Lewinellaceae bacterium]
MAAQAWAGGGGGDYGAGGGGGHTGGNGGNGSEASSFNSGADQVNTDGANGGGNNPGSVVVVCLALYLSNWLTLRHSSMSAMSGCTGARLRKKITWVLKLNAVQTAPIGTPLTLCRAAARASHKTGIPFRTMTRFRRELLPPEANRS